MMRLRVLVAVLLLAASGAVPRVASAQGAPAPTVADSTVEVRLRDGSVLYGRVVERSESRLVLVTAGGARIELEMIQVASLRAVRARGRGGEYWVPDPNATRLFFSSTARPVAKGEGYVSSYFLFFPMVAYGVTDRITLAGGTPILPGLMGELWYFAPKVTLLSRERLSVAVGALGFFIPELSDGDSFGIGYLSGTMGSTENAVTVGAGWGYFSQDGTTEFSSRPVFMVGGERRTGASVKLITENWLAFGDGEIEGVVSGGARFIGSRLSADLGLGTGLRGGCCFPMVNFVYAFGNRAR